MTTHANANDRLRPDNNIPGGKITSLLGLRGAHKVREDDGEIEPLIAEWNLSGPARERVVFDRDGRPHPEVDLTLDGHTTLPSHDVGLPTPNAASRLATASKFAGLAEMWLVERDEPDCDPEVFQILSDNIAALVPLLGGEPIADGTYFVRHEGKVWASSNHGPGRPRGLLVADCPEV